MHACALPVGVLVGLEAMGRVKLALADDLVSLESN
jgi:hypothetical protein